MTKHTTKKHTTKKSAAKAATKARLHVVKSDKDATPVSRASKNGNLKAYASRIRKAVEKAKGHSISMEQAADAVGLKRPGLGLVTVLHLVQMGWLHQSSDRRISLPKAPATNSNGRIHQQKAA